MIHLLIALLQLCRLTVVAASEVIHVRPLNGHCDTSTVNDCHTLSELIESRRITNETTMILLAGVHLINSKQHNVVYLPKV